MAAACLALASCKQERTTLSCSSAADCPAGTDCVLGACISGGLPVASIALRTGELLVTHRAIEFDGSVSTDPNPGHGLVSYAWSVRRGSSARCDPSPATSGDARFSTIFLCEGDYEIALKVTDDLGLESAPATLSVTIDRSVNPPSVSVGPDLAVAHRCAGSPPVCSAIADGGGDRLQLRATASDAENGSALGLVWEAVPPAGVDATRAHVTFEPNAEVAAPTVRIWSEGARIAGEWQLTVRVTDADGLTTPAVQKVTIGNEAPVVTPVRSPLATAHTYSAAARLYVAADEVVAAVTDPDGDPIEAPDLVLEEDAPSGCAFEVKRVGVADGQLAAAFTLTASAGQEQAFLATARQLIVSTRDVNGADARTTVPLLIQNRPPQLTWNPAVPGASTRTLGVPHAFAPTCGSGSGCFTAHGRSPLVAVDPDGDPVGAVELTASGAAAGTQVVLSGPEFSISTDARQAPAFRNTDGTSPITFTARARDPWGPTADGASAQFRVVIENSPPRAVRALEGSAPITYSGPELAYTATGAVAAFVDDDGDPLALAAGGGDAYCSTFAVDAGGTATVACRFSHDASTGVVPALAPFVTTHELQVSARDPWASGAPVATSIAIRDDHPPLNPGGAIAVDSCTCGPTDSCGFRWYQVNTGSVRARVPVSDPEGTPVYGQVTLSCGSLPQGATFVGADPSIVLDLASCHLQATATVTVTDGLLERSAAYPVSVTCSKAGQVCGHGPASGFCP